jgi:hypothetical protein
MGLAMSDYQVCVDLTASPATLLQGVVTYLESNAAREPHPIFDSPPPREGRASLVLQIRSDLSVSSSAFTKDGTCKGRLWLGVAHARAPLCSGERAMDHEGRLIGS